MSQAEALWESKSQIAGLACQDIRYKGPVYQTVRQNNNNNQSTHDFYHERLPSRATIEVLVRPIRRRQEQRHHITTAYHLGVRVSELDHKKVMQRCQRSGLRSAIVAA
jgi:hypothetical protein